MLRYLVEYTFAGLSGEKDYQDIVKFFKDKDTSKYSQALAQALESIRAKIGWIDVCATERICVGLSADTGCSARLMTWWDGWRNGRGRERSRSTYHFCRD